MVSYTECFSGLFFSFCKDFWGNFKEGGFVMYVERKNFNGVRISDSAESDVEAGEVGLEGRV